MEGPRILQAKTAVVRKTYKNSVRQTLETKARSSQPHGVLESDGWGTLLGLVCSIEERSYAAWDSTGPVVSLSPGALTLSVGSGSVRLPIA